MTTDKTTSSDPSWITSGVAIEAKPLYAHEIDKWKETSTWQTKL
jgi:hypothetical protein